MRQYISEDSSQNQRDFAEGNLTNYSKLSAEAKMRHASMGFIEEEIKVFPFSNIMPSSS